MKKFFYRVSKGDNVYLLCQKFCAPTFSLIAKNKLFCDVEEGDIVYIECDENSYKVGLGESFYSISKKLGVSEEYLKSINATTPYLFYGLVIKIWYWQGIKSLIQFKKRQGKTYGKKENKK